MAGSTPAFPTASVADPAAGVAAVVAPPRRRLAPRRDAWRRFRRHRMALLSAAILSLIVLAVLFGPLFWRVPINDIDFTATLARPSWQHPFGTDDLGQDLLARMLYGGRISLAVGIAAMGMAVLVGVTIGALAGISKGPVDAALMW